MVEDINPGAGDSNPILMGVSGDCLILVAHTPEHGRALLAFVPSPASVAPATSIGFAKTAAPASPFVSLRRIGLDAGDDSDLHDVVR